jgi:hypothetical protein
MAKAYTPLRTAQIPHSQREFDDPRNQRGY